MPGHALFGRAATLSLLFFGELLSAQAPADRPRIDSLFRHLGAATAAAPPLSYACPGDPSLQRLCDALIATRRAELLTDKGEATKARDLLERVVGERPQWPVAWYGLGVARLQVALEQREQGMGVGQAQFAQGLVTLDFVHRVVQGLLIDDGGE